MRIPFHARAIAIALLCLPASLGANTQTQRETKATATPAAEAQAKKHSNEPLEALLRAADAFHYEGRFSEAHETLALAERTALRDDVDAGTRAKFWILRGNIYLSQTTAINSGYEEAEAAAARGLEFAEQSNGADIVADAYDLAGRIHYSRRINLGQGDYEKPLEFFKKALSLRRKTADRRGLVEALFRVGLIHERRNADAKAIEIYNEAFKVAGSDFPLERSNVARHMAYQMQGRGEFDKALKLFEESLELREQAGFLLTRAPALNSIGDLYRRKKEFARALEFNKRAFAEAEKINAKRFMVMALISIGETQQAVGDAQWAREHWRRAEKLAKEIGYVSGIEQARDRLTKLK